MHWRKIAFAAVVSLVAVTKEIIVAACAAPTAKTAADQRRRADGSATSSIATANAARSVAICQLDSVHALMEAPPVEKRTAVASR